jgi:tetratricopeptide (TPR) repeat protein
MRRTYLLSAILFFGFSAPASANDAEICFKQSGDAAIAACSAAISSGNYKGDRLAELYNSRGAEWRLKDNYERAIADYNEALNLAPGYAAALSNRCWAFAVTGKGAEALADCNESLRLRPGNDGTHNNRCLANFRLGNLDAALGDCQIALDANATRSQAMFLRGLIKSRRGDIAGANADIAAAKKIRASIESDFEKIGIRR